MKILNKSLTELTKDISKLYSETFHSGGGDNSTMSNPEINIKSYSQTMYDSNPIQMELIKPKDVKIEMQELKKYLHSFLKDSKFNLILLEETQVKLQQLIGKILYFANYKKKYTKRVKNLLLYVEILSSFIKLINDKLMNRKYDKINDLEVLQGTFKNIILQNQENIIIALNLLINRLPEESPKESPNKISTKNKLIDEHRKLSKQIKELKDIVTKRIITLNGGKPYSISTDKSELQIGGNRETIQNSNQCFCEKT